MTYPMIPPTIPACALRQGWALRPIDTLRRTEMEDGNIAVQRRLSRIGGIQSLTWEMSGAQFDLLVAFWAEELDAGAAWFYAPVVEGTRTTLRLMRFFGGEPPWQGTSPANGIFAFSFEAELRELPLLSPAERMAVELYVMDPDGLQGLIDQLQPIVAALGELTP